MSQQRQSPLFTRTKLGPPRLSRSIVRRELAARALEMGISRALTLVTAPAGFGKTTLLTEWRETLLGERRVVAWLTLDRDDNDTANFLDYLCQALLESSDFPLGDLHELRAAGGFSAPKTVLSTLINAIDRLDQEITLFLDDYDSISNPAIHDLLAFLLLHIPRNLHLVLATRSEPPLPLSTLRAHDQLVEIDTADLRFEIEDTRSFLAAASSLKLSITETRAIHDAAEGWVTGLQIAAIALRGRKSPSLLISGISGQSKAISGYLAENVLPQVPEETLAFMLRTSILERLNGDLCNQVAGVADGEAKLEWLAGQNMFLQKLGGEGKWYRYHALFADFLRTQLDARLAAEGAALHERAAAWFAAHELWSEAVKHALAAERVDLAVAWVERCAMREVEDSRVNNLLLWVRKLPEGAIRTRPNLRFALAWALLLTMKLEQAGPIIADLQAHIAAGEIPHTPEQETELLALRVCQAALRDDMDGALDIGRASLSALVQESRSGRESTWAQEAFFNATAYAQRLTGQLDDLRALQPLLYRPWHKDVRNLFTLSYRTSVLSVCDIREARFQQCAERLRSVIAICEERAGRSSPAATLLACHLAVVLHEWNQPEAVEELLANRLDIIDDTSYLDAVLDAYTALTRVAASRRDFTLAHTLLDRAEAVGHHRGWARLLIACAAERIHLWLDADRLSEAERGLRLLRGQAEAACAANAGPRAEILGHLIAAETRVGLFKQDYAAALAALPPRIAADEAAGDVYGALRMRMLLATAQAGARDHKAAQATLGEMLAACAGSGIIRLIADAGAEMLQAFARLPALREPRYAAYAADLLPLLSGGAPAPLPALPATESQAAPTEALSDREQDVLDLVAKGLSNKLIAKTLLITPETVKWHLKNIYGKLGVSGRTLAVHQAQKLGATRSAA